MGVEEEFRNDTTAPSTRAYSLAAVEEFLTAQQGERLRLQQRLENARERKRVADEAIAASTAAARHVQEALSELRQEMTESRARVEAEANEIVACGRAEADAILRGARARARVGRAPSVTPVPSALAIELPAEVAAPPEPSAPPEPVDDVSVEPIEVAASEATETVVEPDEAADPDVEVPARRGRRGRRSRRRLGPPAEAEAAAAAADDEFLEFLRGPTPFDGLDPVALEV